MNKLKGLLAVLAFWSFIYLVVFASLVVFKIAVLIGLFAAIGFLSYALYLGVSKT